ncbi:YebC/PmpR family DNA-binding transcriptional regulator, partial [bacterium]|nr:YebC/PmpR family DNA-binding transcriptional regulator [bacterium]
VDEDKLMEIALEHGAEDVRDDGDVFTVLTDPDVFNDVNEALVEAGYTDPDAEVTMVPQTTIEVTGKTAVSVMKMIETLEDDDDVQHVYSNFDISDEDMEAMSA